MNFVISKWKSLLRFWTNALVERLSSPRAKWLIGWSHGKETLKSNVYDTLKGSYYVNCAFYVDPALSSAPADEFPVFPEYTAPNIWPSESLLPGFRQTFEELCTMIIDTAVLVAKACDRYALVYVEGYECGYLERVVKTSLTTKARLLHYFPPKASLSTGRTATIEDNPNKGEDEDSWCTVHVDHGCLTGLTSALYVDESIPLPKPASSYQTLSTISTMPDPATGLHIRSRTGSVTKVNIPVDCLAFQTGEALEIITNGKFKAVPHFVKGPNTRREAGTRVARNTLAVFTQPNLGEIVDRERGTTFAEFAKATLDRNT